ncbi:MAG: hypothetical protein QM704_23150 [Anaeromyxobacteraceae bacterium]
MRPALALAALLVASAAAAADAPCRLTDARGRTFPVCFDPGSRLELAGGGAAGDGGAWALRAGLRWRNDARSPAGALEWLRDQTFLAVGLSAGGSPRSPWAGGPRLDAASGVAWSGTFVRRRTSPFLLVPGPAPLRIPFPFDVGLRAEAGAAAWEAARPDRLRVLPLRAALLLDVGSLLGLRRAAFGPEAAWEADLERGRHPSSRAVPFTGGVASLRAESRDGLLAAEVDARAGSALPIDARGKAGAYLRASASAEWTVLAVNERPLALFVEGSVDRGAPGRRTGAVMGLRLSAARVP